MTMDVTGAPAALALGSVKRKWRRKGAEQSKLRYNNNNKNLHKVVRKRSQGLQKRRWNKKRSVPRSVPRAPYNDSSFLMRVRKAGGLESEIFALTPSSSSFMSTPKDSSYTYNTDFVNHEDYGYGSMTGLIRLRPDDGSSGVEDDDRRVERSSVLSAEELEQRLERGVSRFEMTRPVPREFDELRIARQENHVQYLEDENLVLKDRLFLIQEEVNELKQRLQDYQDCNVDVSDESEDSLGRS